MKYIPLFLVLFIGVFSPIRAQDINLGVKGGLNYSNFIGEGNIDSQYRLSYHIGAFAEIPLKGKLSFHPELLYASLGYKLDADIQNFGFFNPEPNSGNLKGKVVSSNLIVPLIAKYDFNDRLSLQFGPQLGFLLQTTSDFNPEGEAMKESGNFRFTYGATLGMGFDPTDKLRLQLRYYLGLKNFFDEVFRESEFEKRYSYESVFQLSVGYVLF